MSFAGLRVLSLESRRARDMEALIVRHGGVPLVAPSVRERAAGDHGAAVRFVEQLESGDYDMVICMTGVGLSFLKEVIAARMPLERLSAALRRATILSRGPKPVAVLRSLDVPVGIVVPEPNTWREIVEAVRPRAERRIALLEYGRPNLSMNEALASLGAQTTQVALYRWEMPEDLGPLREAVRRLASRQIDVVLFTSSIQLDHLFEAARELRLEQAVQSALAEDVAIASVGPVMTATLEARGLAPAIVPLRPRMASLVKAAAAQAACWLSGNRVKADVI
jgi:uroporphyrinogen-III synthase